MAAAGDAAAGSALGFPGASSQRNGTVMGERRGGVSGGGAGNAAPAPRSATRERARAANSAGGGGREWYADAGFLDGVAVAGASASMVLLATVGRTRTAVAVVSCALWLCWTWTDIELAVAGGRGEWSTDRGDVGICVRDTVNAEAEAGRERSAGEERRPNA